MKILALEPYYGGSHQAFLDGWSSRSRHSWTILGLPARLWKWRMRHSAYTFVEKVHPLIDSGKEWDLLFCSDMMNLPLFLGMAPDSIRSLPSVLYFHENQLTYPDPHSTERDCHYGMVNLLSSMSASRVWFNSIYNRDSFLDALPSFLDQMPEYPPKNAVERIQSKSAVFPQGIDPFPSRDPRKPGPLRILWAARWEHDKDPESFFKAMAILRDRGVAFRLNVIGQKFRQSPPIFETARNDFQDWIDRWGYQKSRKSYCAALFESDVFVSTAIHEFFGVSTAEAIAGGNYPLLPHRLAYPELLGISATSSTENHAHSRFLYDGTPEDLAHRLESLSHRLDTVGSLWDDSLSSLQSSMMQFEWPNLVSRLDDALEAIQ